jgi:hypothetical protein
MGDAEAKSFLTVREFSVASGFSEMTIRRMVKGRQLASIQPTGNKGKWFIPRKALDDLNHKAFGRVETGEGEDSRKARLPIPGRKPNWLKTGVGKLNGKRVGEDGSAEKHGAG